MMLFARILSFICVFAALAEAADEKASTKATPPTPQEEYDAAVKHAEDAMASLSKKVGENRNIAHNDTLIAAIKTKFLKNASATKRHVLQSVRHAQAQAKADIRGSRSAAKKAARAVKAAAREVEKSSKKAGAHEHDYEKAYDQGEHLSEHMEDHVEDLGDDSEDDVEHIYESVKLGVEKHFEEAERQAEKVAEKVRTSGSKETADVVSAEGLLAEPSSSSLDSISLIDGKGQRDSKKPASTPQQEYEAAVKQAEDALASLDKKVRDLRDTAHNKTLITAMQAKFLKNDSNSRQQVLHNVHQSEASVKTQMRTLVMTAKKAARLIKSKARTVEKASKKAGAYEHDYEGAYMRGERLSETMELHGERLGDASEEHVEGIYESVALGVQKHFEEAEKQVVAGQKSQAASSDTKKASELSAESLLAIVPSSDIASPSDELQQLYDAAVKRAKNSIAELHAKVRDLRNTAHNKTLVAAMQTKLLKNVSKTKEEVLHSVHETEVQAKAHMRGLRSAAKKAARAIKSAAREAEKASRTAGAHENEYERVYDQGESLSERLEDYAENLGDESEDYVERIYEPISDGVRQHFDDAETHAKSSKASETKANRAETTLFAVPTRSFGDFTLLVGSDNDDKKKQMPTPEQEYNAAVKKAEDAIDAFEHKVRDLHDTASNATLIAASLAKVMKNAGNSTYHDVRRSVHEAEAHTKTRMRSLRTAAKNAARAIKVAARKVEKASGAAGVHENTFERAYDKGEHLSEHMEDHVIDLGDAVEDYAESIKESVMHGVEHSFASKSNQLTNARDTSMVAAPTWFSADAILLVLCMGVMVAGTFAVSILSRRPREEEITTYTLLA